MLRIQKEYVNTTYTLVPAGIGEGDEATEGVEGFSLLAMRRGSSGLGLGGLLLGRRGRRRGLLSLGLGI